MIATVTDTSPLRVREDGAASDLGAIALAHYTPVLADRVVAVKDAGVVYLLGALP